MISRYSSDQSVLLDFEPDERDQIPQIARGIEQAFIPGVRDVHPAYASILVVYDPLVTDADELGRRVFAARQEHLDSYQPRIIEVPVRYGGENGPDLKGLAEARGLTVKEVIELHSSALYSVAFLGFAPGFGYLTGLPEELATPRLAVPRKLVPAGSVGIAGLQTGIYPIATPGGWNLIGRTSLKMFDLNRYPMSLLSIGDRVRFTPE
jgi:KipI family sensor histidine kinase inhibitor